jgi:hypothetical protein
MNEDRNDTELKKARRLYLELEWRLASLKSATPQPRPEPTDEELLLWYRSSD